MKQPSNEIVSLTRKIFSNMSYQLVLGGLGGIFSVVHSGLLSRYLGVSGFGAFSVILAHVLLFYGFTNWGADTIAIQKMSQKKGQEKEWFVGLITLRVALAMLSYLGCLVFLPLARYSAELNRQIVIFATVILFAPFEGLLAVYQTYLRTGVPVLVSLTVQGLTVLGTLAAIRCRASLTILVAIAAFGTAARSLFLSVRLREFLILPCRYSWTIWRRLIVEGFPIAAASVCSMMVGRFSIFIVSHYHGTQAVGLFAAPFRLIFFLMFIPQAVMVPAFPLLCRYQDTDSAHRNALFHRSHNALLWGAIPLGIVCFILAEPIMRLAFGAAFLPAVNTFRILTLTLMLVFISLTAGYLMVAAGRQRTSFVYNVWASLIGVLLMILLVPKWSTLGAAWGLVATQFLLAVLTFQYLPKLGIRLEGRPIGLGLFSGGLMAFIMNMIGPAHWLASLIAGVLVYVGTLTGLLGGFHRQGFAAVISREFGA